MGNLGDPRVAQLVRGLCESVPYVTQDLDDDGDSVASGSSCGDDVRPQRRDHVETLEEECDGKLARLVEAGFPIEPACDVLRVNPSWSLEQIIDSLLMQGQSIMKDPSSSAHNNGFSSSQPTELVRRQSASRAMGKWMSGKLDRIGSSKQKVYPDDDPPNEHEEMEIVHSRPHGVVDKGKGPVDGPFEENVNYGSDSEPGAPNSDPWGQESEEGGKQATLSRMGFAEKLIDQAIQTCGEDQSVDELCDFILRHLKIHPESDPDWGEDDYLDEEMGNVELFLPEKSSLQGKAAKSLLMMGFNPDNVCQAVEARGEDASEDDLIEFLEGSSPYWVKLRQLLKMEYSLPACKRALDSYADGDIDELVNFMKALEYEAEEECIRNTLEDDDDDRELSPPHVAKSSKRQSKDGLSGIPVKRRKNTPSLKSKRTGHGPLPSAGCPVKIKTNRTGFGVPGYPVIPRNLPEDVKGAPYFYFENVCTTPKGSWENIQRHLYNIKPEFVDSLNFTACRRPRGYIHNLPVEGRLDLLPKPPMTIQEVMEQNGMDGSWPRWDDRVKLCTINTSIASHFVRRKVMQCLQKSIEEERDPTKDEKEDFMFWAKKWNLIWLNSYELSPLTMEETEVIMGFNRHHTRSVFSNINRAKLLGNSFQVNTVAYHFSVLKPLFPQGMRVLSLFTGIGGAEVALHKLGIHLKVVVSVEIDENARSVLKYWWKSTGQRGVLVHDYHDVNELDFDVVRKLVSRFGGFDLVVGGSPCNNLSGNNRCTRVGLEGESSIAFFEFPRILTMVKDCMRAMRR